MVGGGGVTCPRVLWEIRPWGVANRQRYIHPHSGHTMSKERHVVSIARRVHKLRAQVQDKQVELEEYENELIAIEDDLRHLSGETTDISALVSAPQPEIVS